MSATHDYFTCAETAKLVRAALRNQLPGIKFRVRSHNYAGGASIDVNWTDGPLADQVQSVVSIFSGASFDGMIDLKSYHDTLVADDDGNVRSVHFGADFIFANRHVSAARLAIYKRELERFIGEKLTGGYQPVKVSIGRYGDYSGQLCRDEHSHEDARNIIQQLGYQRPWHGTTCPGGDGNYCPGCGRFQGDHRAPHLH